MIFITCTKSQKIECTIGDLYWNGVKVKQVGPLRCWSMIGEGEMFATSPTTFTMIPNTEDVEDQSFYLEVDIRVGEILECIREEIILRPQPEALNKIYLNYGSPE